MMERPNNSYGWTEALAPPASMDSNVATHARLSFLDPLLDQALPQPSAAIDDNFEPLAAREARCAGSRRSNSSKLALGAPPTLLKLRCEESGREVRVGIRAPKRAILCKASRFTPK